MKIIKNITYIVLLTLIFSSCEDFLEAPNKSSVAEDVLFSDPGLAEGAVMGIYNMFLENNSYRNRLALYLGVNTDIELHSSSNNGASSNDRKALAVYNNKPDNTEFNSANGQDPFSRVYSAIERANICIKGIREYGNPEPDTKMGFLLGEALTLRAFLYNDLVKWWGDVPARFEPTTNETIYLPKADRDSIYKQIIADLQEAEDLVPWPNDISETQTTERVNKAFVKGLRARICLAAGGYSLRPVGGIRLSNDPALDKTKMYTIAKNECSEIIRSEKCKLDETFEQIFKDNCKDVVTAGNESVFELPYSDTRGQMLTYCGLRHENIAGDVDQYATTNIKGEFGPAPFLFYEYSEKDQRRDVTCSPYKWSDGKQTLSSINQFYFGKYRAEWMSPEKLPLSSNDDGVNPIMMRYADILLMFAEAENELHGPTDSAKMCLREVRARAFAPEYQDSLVDQFLDTLTTKELFFEAIVNERALEFAGEQIRKFDLIRWGMLKSKMDEGKVKTQQLRDGLSPFDGFPKYAFWRLNDDEETIEIFGLNKGEEPKDSVGNVLDEEAWDDWKNTYDGGGWNDFTDSEGFPKSWINGSPTTGDLKDSWISASFYAKDPDKYQILPLMNIILANSNGTLTNDYEY